MRDIAPWSPHHRGHWIGYLISPPCKVGWRKISLNYWLDANWNQSRILNLKIFIKPRKFNCNQNNASNFNGSWLWKGQPHLPPPPPQPPTIHFEDDDENDYPFGPLNSSNFKAKEEGIRALATVGWPTCHSCTKMPFSSSTFFNYQHALPCEF